MKNELTFARRGALILEIAVAVAVILMLLFPVGRSFELIEGEITQKFLPGTVLSVDSEEISDSVFAKGQKVGQQELTVRLFGGREITVYNYITDTHNIVAKVGSRIIICADEPGGDIEPYYTVYSYNRLFPVVLLVIMFAALMVAVGKRKGVDAFLAILFSLVFILNVSLPLLHNGVPAIPVGLVTVLVATAVTILLIHGVTKQCLYAVCTTLMGELAACLIFALFAELLHISGFQSDDAETLLLVTRRTGLDVYHLLIAGMMISSLGAVMDVAVSILSSLREISLAMEKPTKGDLFKSGMNIGKDLIGTMANTLIFAFVGGSIAAMLVFYSYGVQPMQLLNSNYLALELSQGICSTMAVILTVPFAAAVGAAVFARVKR